jgi:PIN domain nuclease of toxin-antitoxin system
MLIAQSLRESLAFVTSDKRLKTYDCDIQVV